MMKLKCLFILITLTMLFSIVVPAYSQGNYVPPPLPLRTPEEHIEDAPQSEIRETTFDFSFLQDLIDGYENGFSWVFLAFALFWGGSFFHVWAVDTFGNGFLFKLINSIYVISTFVFFVLICLNYGVLEAIGLLLGGILVGYIGCRLLLWVDNFRDNPVLSGSEEWSMVSSILSGLALIAMFILLGHGI